VKKKEQRLSLSVLCALPFKVTSLFHRPHMRKRLRLRFWLGAGAGGSMLVLRCSCCWWVFISRRLGVFFFFLFLIFERLILNSAAIVVCLLHFTSLQFCTASMLRSVQFNLAQSSVQVGLVYSFVVFRFGFWFWGESAGRKFP